MMNIDHNKLMVFLSPPCNSTLLLSIKYLIKPIPVLLVATMKLKILEIKNILMLKLIQQFNNIYLSSNKNTLTLVFQTLVKIPLKVYQRDPQIFQVLSQLIIHRTKFQYIIIMTTSTYK